MHHALKIGVWSMQDEVIVISHQRIAVALRTELLETGFKDLEKLTAITRVSEDCLLPIASCHYVIDSSAKHDPIFRRHDTIGAKRDLTRACLFSEEIRGFASGQSTFLRPASPSDAAVIETVLGLIEGVGWAPARIEPSADLAIR
jgi:hypothetical protein